MLELGLTATAAISFFREIGASLGITVVGTLFAIRLTKQLVAGQAEPVAYAAALIPILGWLAPLCLIALLLVSAIRPVPLRISNEDQQPEPTPRARPTP